MKLTNEILEQRKGGIGGSDCAAVLGLSKWATPLDIYLSKTDENYRGKQMTDAMRNGQRLEPIVIECYEELTATKVEQPGVIFKHEKYPWLLANVDGIIPDKNILLEAKTTGNDYDNEWGEPGTDYMPTQYLYQVAHYCLVLNRPSIDIALWSYTRPLRIYRYFRNKELEQQIIDGVHDFWHNHVLLKIPPKPIDIADELKLYSRGNATKSIVADKTLIELAEKQKQLKAEEKELKTKIDFVENEIKIYMKDNTYLINEKCEKLISWKDQEAQKFQQKEFKEAEPLLYNKFTKPAHSRVLRNHLG